MYLYVQNSAFANNDANTIAIKHWNWDTALTIPTSQALELNESGNVTIGNVYHSRLIVTSWQQKQQDILKNLEFCHVYR